MRSAQVTFDLADVPAERTFLESYLAPAWERFEAHESLRSAWFWRFGTAGDHGRVALEDGTVVEDGGVVLVLNGDPDPTPLLDAERDRWEALTDEGVVDRWERTYFDPAYENARAKSVENFGAVGGDRAVRLRPLVSAFTLSVVEEFDERLPAVGEPSDDDPLPVGYWAVIHYLLKQQGYDWYDEIDACLRAIRNRVRSLAAFHGDEVAREALEDAVAELRAVEPTASAGR